MAGAFKPLISQPAGRTAVSGIVDRECFVAVRGNTGLIAQKFNLFDAMQDAFSGRPQLDFFDEPKKLYSFAVISFGRCFGCHFVLFQEKDCRVTKILHRLSFIWPPGGTFHATTVCLYRADGHGRHTDLQRIVQ